MGVWNLECPSGVVSRLGKKALQSLAGKPWTVKRMIDNYGTTQILKIEVPHIHAINFSIQKYTLPIL